MNVKLTGLYKRNLLRCYDHSCQASKDRWSPLHNVGRVLSDNLALTYNRTSYYCCVCCAPAETVCNCFALKPRVDLPRYEPIFV